MYNDQTSLNEILNCKVLADKRELISTYIESMRATVARKNKLRLDLQRMNVAQMDRFIVNIYLVGEGLKVI